MYVFGYTSDKDVVKVDLPIEVVVAKGIDPWRLDLFDLDPIMLDVDGQMLRFTRIGDVVFAYESGKEIIVAMHDGKNPTCIRGNFFCSVENGGDDDSVHLRNITPIEGAFRQHLHEYLHRIFAAEDAYRLWAPRPADHLHCRNGNVRLQSVDFHDGRNAAFWMQCRFMGEMFTRIDSPCPTPPNISRVLKGIERWRPVVFGPGLSDMLLGKPISCLDVRVDAIGRTLERTLLSLGCKCDAINVYYADDLALRIYSRPNGAQNSRQDHHASAPSQARRVIDRVSLYDASKNQARPLAGDVSIKDFPCTKTGWWSIEHEPVVGVQLLPDVFSPSHVAHDCHCEPIVPVYAEVLRRAWCDQSPGALTFGGGVVSSGGPRLVFRAKLRHNRPEEGKGLSISAPTEYKSWQFMRNILLELSADALRQFKSGERSSACFTTRELAYHLRKLVESDRRLSPDTRFLWLKWLDSELEQDVRLDMLKEIRRNIFSTQSRDCDRLFATYLDLARAEIGGDVTLSEKQRLLLTSLETTAPLSLSPPKPKEFRQELLAKADDYTRGGIKYRENGLLIPYTAFDAVSEAIELYVLNQPRPAAPPSEDDERTHPGAACAYWINKALIRDFDYCDYCAQQFFAEGAKHAFRPHMLPTM